jgi:hypothetical protein
MPERPMTTAEEDVAQIAAQHGTDPLLIDLVALGEAGAGLAVGLLMNGMIVTGALGSAIRTAEELDARRSKLFMMAANTETEAEMAEDFEATAEKAKTMSVSRYERRRERRDKASAEIDSYLGEDGVLDPRIAPAELMRTVIDENERRYFDLTQVSIAAPGQVGTIKLPVLRVCVAQIAAWWVADFDDEGRSTIALWQSP